MDPRQELRADRARQDLTSRLLIARHRKVRAVIVAKEDLVVAGLSIAKQTFKILDSSLRFRAEVSDGTQVKKGRVLARLQGHARAILGAERTALNFLQHLSGIASLTRKVVERVSSYKIEVFDTRKTLPGLRDLQKYAVRVGGGKNHRSNLAAEILVKDNHIALCGGVRAALEKLSRQQLSVALIEVTNIRDARTAIACGAHKLLCDNMTPSALKGLVRTVRGLNRKVWIEASGGITEHNAVAYAQTGVDAISLGALTHSAPAVDISLEVEPVASPEPLGYARNKLRRGAKPWRSPSSENSRGRWPPAGKRFRQATILPA